MRYRGWRDGCMDGLEREVQEDGYREGLNGRSKNGDARDWWREGDFRREEIGEPVVWWRNEVSCKNGDIRGWVERWGE